MTTSAAQANPNIAFIKYWGNRDNTLRLPVNGSISMNLDGLSTRTTVSFQPSLPFDELIFNTYEVTGAGLERASYILDLILEYEDVLPPQRTELGLSQDDVADFIDSLCSMAHHYKIYFL